MSDTGSSGDGSRSDNPLDVLAQAGAAERRPVKRSSSPASSPDASDRRTTSPRAEADPGDSGPPTQPVATAMGPADDAADADAGPGAASPPRTSRNLTRARRNPKPTPAAAKGAGATVTGIVLVLVAVAIGAVLLSMGYDREQGLVTAPRTTPSESTSTLVPNSPVGNVPGVPSGTNAVLKAPSTIVVKVGKAGAPEGVASADAQKLKNAGYTLATAFDSPANLPASQVYFQPGFQGEALEVAKVFKIPESAVLPMPNPPPDPTGGTPANVIVLLGQEARAETT
jgi:hypothetical protein